MKKSRRNSGNCSATRLSIPKGADMNQIMRAQSQPVYYTPTDLYPVLMNGGRHDIVLINPKFEQ